MELVGLFFVNFNFRLVVDVCLAVNVEEKAIVKLRFTTFCSYGRGNVGLSAWAVILLGFN